MSPLRFGIVGTNFISEWFVKGCRRTNGRAAATAVLSRRRDTGEAFARANDVELVFDDFDRMAEAVDAIYIASPNALHHPQALRAMFETIAAEQPGLQLPSPEQLRTVYQGRGKVPGMRVARDVGFRMPSIWFAEGHSQVAPVYLYRFDFCTPMLRLLRLGAEHRHRHMRVAPAQIGDEPGAGHAVADDDDRPGVTGPRPRAAPALAGPG